MIDKSGEPSKSVGKISLDERAEFERRLSDLDGRLDNAQDRKPDQQDGDGPGKAIGYGLRIATDLIAAILVGAGIGWYLDKWMGTQPILLLIFIALGLAAGARNVIRTYHAMTAEYGENTGTDTDDLSVPINKDDTKDDTKDKL